MMGRTRIAGMGISAALLVALVSHEGYTDKAVIPVKGDRPTVGFGSTFKEDGSAVTMSDTTTPVKALQRTLKHIQKDERGIQACVTAPLFQHEYDTMVDFSYQYGVKRLCSSSMVSLANAGDYKGSCQAYALYSKVAGRECSIRSNGCYGVYLRNQKRVKSCMGGE